MKNNIQGVGVALVTPFDMDGNVDYQALGTLTESMIDDGVDYLVVLGTTAETPTLTCSERKSVIEFVKDRNAGRLPIIVGVGGYCTREVIESIHNTDMDGIAAVLSVTPYYNKPNQEGLYRHYEAVAGESPVPVMLYNVPGRTGVNMTAETTLRIARNVPNVLGVKEACGNINQMSAILVNRPENFKVISGDDCLALPLMAIGGDGVISVAANAFPREVADMVHAASVGDVTVSSAIYARLYETMAALFVEGNPTGIKAAMALKGICGKGVRLPLVESSDRLDETLKHLMGHNGLI